MYVEAYNTVSNIYNELGKNGCNISCVLYIVKILAGPHSQVVHESRVHDITSVNVN